MLKIDLTNRLVHPHPWRMRSSKNVLLVYAHPEPTSLTRSLVEVAAESLQNQGHSILRSDLYGMGWKAVMDADDFPVRADPKRLSFVTESGHAYSKGLQPLDIASEQKKLMAADALILHFPLWWYAMPAILEGWIDRVWAYGLAYGYRGEGNRYRYGEGGLAGKRAMLCVTVGGPETDYSPRGINGPLEQLLFPITHGTLFFPGMEVLPTFAVYGAGSLTPSRAKSALVDWRERVRGLFVDPPIPFRAQSGGDYSDQHVLNEGVAPAQTGLMAHIRETRGPDVPDLGCVSEPTDAGQEHCSG